MPPTDSPRPSLSEAPWRTAWPVRTSATSPIVTAVPASDFSTIDRMSASDWIMPTPRMMYSSDPRVTTLPPTFALLRWMAWRTPSTDRSYFEQAVGVDQDFELLDVAAERVHLGDAGDALQHRRDHPVLERAEPHQLAHAFGRPIVERRRRLPAFGSSVYW